MRNQMKYFLFLTASLTLIAQPLKAQEVETNRFTEMNYGEQTFIYDRNGRMVAAGVGDEYGMYYSNRYGQTIGTRYNAGEVK
tara:strand:+ start:308 stop:553 length:246 start_codon:yes stop_codon:yes gene_type:complete